MSKKTNNKKEKLTESCISKEAEFEVKYTDQFLKDVIKNITSKSAKIKLCEAIKELSVKGDLETVTYKAHNLKGQLKGLREAHIKNDLLIIWIKEDEKNILLISAGSHSYLFD